jgi:hypothetical protein
MRIKTFVQFVLLLLVLSGVYLMQGKKAPEVHPETIASSARIAYPSDFNYRQTINDCGPFNVAAVVRALKPAEEVDSGVFAAEMKWRLPNNYTIPWGLEKQLKDNDVHIAIPYLKSLSDIDKAAYLREQLSLGHPVIILGERDYYEHYITLLGFDTMQDVFYVYDSFYDKGEEGMTIDSNGDTPGNRNYSTGDLLDFWRGGGMYGQFEWYAIVALP